MNLPDARKLLDARRPIAVRRSGGPPPHHITTGDEPFKARRQVSQVLCSQSFKGEVVYFQCLTEPEVGSDLAIVRPLSHTFNSSGESELRLRSRKILDFPRKVE